MTDERGVQRREIKNAALNIRVTAACMGNLLDSYWINFTGFNGVNREMTDNPARTRDSLWIVIR